MNRHGYDDSYKKGHEAVLKIVNIVRKDWGFHDFNPNPNEIDYTDKQQRDQEWDCEYYGPKWECKELTCKFTEPETFPHKTPYVMTQYSWDILIEKPIMVLLYSEPTGRILGIDTVATRDKWILGPWWLDWRKQKMDRCWALPSKDYLMSEAQIREKLYSIIPCTAPVVR